MPVTGIVFESILTHFIFSNSDHNASFETQLIEAAEDVNKICLFIVDGETRLDNAIGGIGGKFIYNNTYKLAVRRTGS